jgi:Na+/H+ antiporter NhaD/arsenite permease-like protein
MGTTGAAMLLIRPFLRANNYRKSRTFMVVFFIFLVANIGGSLTPAGGPAAVSGIFCTASPFSGPLKSCRTCCLVAVLLW